MATRPEPPGSDPCLWRPVPKCRSDPVWIRLRSLAGTEGPAAASPVVAGLLEAGYWVLPKPVDLEAVCHEAVGAQKDFRPLPEFRALESGPEFS